MGEAAPRLLRPLARRSWREETYAALPETLHPVIRRVYAARNVMAGEVGLALKDMLPVSSLEQADAAAARLLAARERAERVLIVGDFDADGATATALMMICLRAFGFSEPMYAVPDRQRFGYGLSAGIVDYVAHREPDLIITVDNGISSFAGVERAHELGIDVIVTDHHLPGEQLPQADVIVNPNHPDSDFASKSLAGVGVAFYVMAALGQQLAGADYIDADEARSVCSGCLDLVALGSVADLVSLDRNNRILIEQGLARMRNGGSRPGITALFALADRNINAAVASDLGFAIGPRLNAAGRLDDMSVGIECLLAADHARAHELASLLSQLNEARRGLQANMQEDAERYLDKIRLQGDTPGHAVCLYDPDWHSGVVGLVASRVKDIVNRPVFAFAAVESGDELKGSGRSVAGVHLRDVLAAIDAQHPGMMDRFGGHAMAAGLSLAPGMLEPFRQALLAEVGKHAQQIDDSGTLLTDGELDADCLALEFAEQLRLAGPWGQGFPEPLFEGRFRVIEQRIVGEKHLKLRVRCNETAAPIDAIAFNHERLLAPDELAAVLLVFRLDVNEFRQARRPQLVVEHIESV
jgi:single-stranded-DNA-specific exonuclease